MIVFDEEDVEVSIDVKITVESGLMNKKQINILFRSILPRFPLLRLNARGKPQPKPYCQ